MMKKLPGVEELFSVNEKPNKMKKHLKLGSLYLVQNDQEVIQKIENLCKKKNATIIKFLCYEIKNVEFIDSFIAQNQYDIVIFENWNETNETQDHIKRKSMELKRIAKKHQIPIIVNAKNHTILWNYCHCLIDLYPMTKYFTFTFKD